VRKFPQHQAGRSFIVVLVCIVILVLIGAIYLSMRTRSTSTARSLTIYCAAGLRVPVEQTAAKYLTEYDVETEIQYGGSNTLLNQLEVTQGRNVDLYIAADNFYTDLAIKKDLVAETIPVATMHPVIAVARGNPKKIQGVKDLLRDDLRVAAANPDQAAVGRAIRECLSAITIDGDQTLWQQLEPRVTADGVFKPTVTEVANDVKLGSVDAGLIWDSTAALPKYRDSIESIEVPEFNEARHTVSLAVVKASKTPTAVLRFARYLAAKDQGLPVFGRYGFKPVDGDLWAAEPEITFFCGAVNRRAVDDVIKAFQQREGVTVNTIYNGCGILTGQMKTIRKDHGGKGFPDVYMACDRYYLENVKEWFQEDADVSDADIVIAVPKGNPKNIQSLADLTKDGIRVSVGQPEQCTIGALTRIMLEKEGVRDAVMKNVVTQTASSAMLVPTVTTKSVDATLAYITDTIAESDKVDAVRIESPHAKAIQPFSIARSSEHKYLGRRLFQAIVSARDKFESAGFHFRYSPDLKDIVK
jgi:molybdenum ABC transporter molybdate-binding protein